MIVAVDKAFTVTGTQEMGAGRGPHGDSGQHRPGRDAVGEPDLLTA